MKKYYAFLFLSIFGISASAQNVELVVEEIQKPTKHVYFSGSMSGHLISSSILEKGNDKTKMTVPRYTAFFHFGTNMNFDFNKNVGLFAGFDVKNIGFIEKYPQLDSTVIRRSYTIGIPVGIKLGNFNVDNYVFLGGGVDMPFHYKEKGFVQRRKKQKTTEWFSNRTETLLPYAFVGAHLRPGFTMKLQYYPTNFLNSDFADKSGFKPYEDYNVNMVILSLGLNINYTPKTYWD